jgi:hypothetical protein
MVEERKLTHRNDGPTIAAAHGIASDVSRDVEQPSGELCAWLIPVTIAIDP